MTIEKMIYYYVNGYWDISRLDKLKAAGKITEEEYQTIVSSKN